MAKFNNAQEVWKAMAEVVQDTINLVENSTRDLNTRPFDCSKTALLEDLQECLDDANDWTLLDSNPDKFDVAAELEDCVQGMVCSIRNRWVSTYWQAIIDKWAIENDVKTWRLNWSVEWVDIAPYENKTCGEFWHKEVIKR